MVFEIFASLLKQLMKNLILRFGVLIPKKKLKHFE